MGEGSRSARCRGSREVGMSGVLCVGARLAWRCSWGFRARVRGGRSRCVAGKSGASKSRFVSAFLFCLLVSVFRTMTNRQKRQHAETALQSQLAATKRSAPQVSHANIVHRHPQPACTCARVKVRGWIRYCHYVRVALCDASAQARPQECTRPHTE